jgi:hypothetical protein
MEEAFKKNYKRYILISGQDLPVKSSKEINDFFENNHCEYLSSDKMPVAELGENGGLDRMTKYWPNCISHGNKNIILRAIYFFARIFFERLSKIVKRPVDYEFYKGTQWINITHECAGKIFEFLKNDQNYAKRYKWTSCSDEIFFHTIIMHYLKGINVVNDRLRYIDWKTGPEFPRILREEDYEKIMASNGIFARKFDEKTDRKIIELIYNKIAAKPSSHNEAVEK